MRFQSCRSGTVQAGGLVTENPGVLPRQCSRLKGSQGERKSGGELLRLRKKGPGGSFADGQYTGDFRGHAHLQRSVIGRIR